MEREGGRGGEGNEVGGRGDSSLKMSDQWSNVLGAKIYSKQSPGYDRVNLSLTYKIT